MTRREAMTAGLNEYTTGKPCIAGHTGMRWTSSGGCKECITATRHVLAREYQQAKAARLANQ